MQTPIADFVREYAKKENSRFHMPGTRDIPSLAVRHMISRRLPVRMHCMKQTAS